MTQLFKFTAKQNAALAIIGGGAKHVMLFGGSRSGKTFLNVRNVVLRALKAPKSRHVILRFRFNACKQSILLDTLPKVLALCFPGVAYETNKTDWYVSIPNGSEIWIGGLDDKERTDKILGKEYATIFFNECSEISDAAHETALTRLAQKVFQVVEGVQSLLPVRAYYDCNPPQKSHWTCQRFVKLVDPSTKQALAEPNDWQCFQINPRDNQENISPDYIKTLQGMSAERRKRFLEGEFKDDNPDALFNEMWIDQWRHNDEVPDLVRVVVGVDPSGANDDPEQSADAIGIVVDGLGIDGNAYLLEDRTIKAGPSTWGKQAVSAYVRHKADLMAVERNFGGEMAAEVIRTAAKDMGVTVNLRLVTSSRGKLLRAEPFSALYEQGKIRHVGRFNELEEELSGFATHGYTGAKSPNRADAHVFALAALFPAMTRKEPVKHVLTPPVPMPASVGGWMA